MSALDLNNRFVLEAVDPETGCISLDLVFETHELGKLCALLHVGPRSFDARASYLVAPEDLEGFKRDFDVDFAAGTMETWLRARRPLDGLPYKIHTNRELSMMLAGAKPLAVFTRMAGDDRADNELHELFFCASRRFKQVHQA